MSYRQEQGKTRGKIWHEQAERENPVFAAIVLFLAMGAVIGALFVFAEPPRAHAAEYSATSVTVEGEKHELMAFEKRKAKAVSKAVKSYMSWNKKMTKKQRKAYKAHVSAMIDTKKASKLKKLQAKCEKLVDRAKLCMHVNAQGYSDKKVANVSHWGKRVNRYLKRTAMRETGYLIASSAYDTNVDPRLYPAIARVESGCGAVPYGCKYNVCGWVCGNPPMHSWKDGISKWHRYFKRWFGGKRYPISSMCGYGGYGPWHVNVQMARI